MSNEQSVQKTETSEPELPFHWQQVQPAIWMIGLVILAITGWWWPGVLVLSAISALVQAGIALYVRRGEEAKQEVAAQKALQEERAGALPAQCPSCGAPLTPASVIWRSNTTASCPYCNTKVRAARPPEAQRATEKNS